MKISIPTISKSSFINRLSKLPYENINVIQSIESFLLKKRGYIFRMPKPKTPVILLVSGGLDSIVTWALLMEKYKLVVYPLFLHRGYKRKWREKAALRYFTQIFQQRYPNLYIPPVEYSTHLPPPEAEKPMYHLTTYYHAARVLENVQSTTGVAEIIAQSGLPFIYPFFALTYASQLWNHNNIKIRTVFNAVATGDGIAVTSQTFAALRTTLLGFCTSTAQYDWQFASLPFEKELGHWIDKAMYIQLGATMNLPLEYTWSCYHSGIFQCGNRCAACIYRRHEFSRSGIPDKTIYACDITPKRLIKRIIRKLIQLN